MTAPDATHDDKLAAAIHEVRRWMIRLDGDLLDGETRLTTQTLDAPRRAELAARCNQMAQGLIELAKRIPGPLTGRHALVDDTGSDGGR